jgi:hypothetical protein
MCSRSVLDGTYLSAVATLRARYEILACGARVEISFQYSGGAVKVCERPPDYWVQAEADLDGGRYGNVEPQWRSWIRGTCELPVRYRYRMLVVMIISTSRPVTSRRRQGEPVFSRESLIPSLANGSAECHRDVHLASLP